jgi:hypothetical protein
MTKSRGVGRGGARCGAGRPKRKTAAPITLPVPTGLSAQELARARVQMAVSTLAEICLSGVSDVVRVRAAKILIRAAASRSVPPRRANR